MRLAALVYASLSFSMSVVLSSWIFSVSFWSLLTSLRSLCSSASVPTGVPDLLGAVLIVGEGPSLLLSDAVRDCNARLSCDDFLSINPGLWGGLPVL